MVYPILTPDHVGHVLQSTRKAQGVTQAALAARVGLSQKRISALELNPGAISIDQLLAICANLGLEVIIQPKEAAATRSAAADW